MAYPFIHCPPWAEMRTNLINNHAVVMVPILNDGKETGDFFLARNENGTQHVFPFPVLLDDDEIVSVSMIRQLCRYLKLPKAEFGLTIEESNPVETD